MDSVQSLGPPDPDLGVTPTLVEGNTYEKEVQKEGRKEEGRKDNADTIPDKRGIAGKLKPFPLFQHEERPPFGSSQWVRVTPLKESVFLGVIHAPP